MKITQERIFWTQMSPKFIKIQEKFDAQKQSLKMKIMEKNYKAGN